MLRRHIQMQNRYKWKMDESDREQEVNLRSWVLGWEHIFMEKISIRIWNYFQKNIIRMGQMPCCGPLDKNHQNVDVQNQITQTEEDKSEQSHTSREFKQLLKNGSKLERITNFYGVADCAQTKTMTKEMQIKIHFSTRCDKEFQQAPINECDDEESGASGLIGATVAKETIEEIQNRILSSVAESRQQKNSQQFH